jgi:predicted RNA-binding Zn-ribbon protein involved in translation (DUF1610 family)
MAVADRPCPVCGSQTLTLSQKLVARPLGEWSLAGAQLKLSVVDRPHLSCSSCGMSVTGTYDGTAAVFHAEDVTYD